MVQWHRRTYSAVFWLSSIDNPHKSPLSIPAFRPCYISWLSNQKLKFSIGYDEKDSWTLTRKENGHGWSLYFSCVSDRTLGNKDEFALPNGIEDLKWLKLLVAGSMENFQCVRWYKIRVDDKSTANEEARTAEVQFNWTGETTSSENWNTYSTVNKAH